MNWRKIRIVLVTALLLSLIPATRYYQIDVPLLRLFTRKGAVDPLTLHLGGEFVEDNLGTEQNSDGSVTVRLIAQQYLFVPHCVLVPAGVPVHLRITSADNVHLLTVDGTNFSVKAIPGAVTQTQLSLTSPGDYKMPCREFCGAGHYAMRSEMRVVPRDQFPVLRERDRGNCAAN